MCLLRDAYEFLFCVSAGMIAVSKLMAGKRQGLRLGRHSDWPWPHVFWYQGETKDLQVKSVYEGETKELEESGECRKTRFG
jgi:hypothetical protein